MRLHALSALARPFVVAFVFSAITIYVVEDLSRGRFDFFKMSLTIALTMSVIVFGTHSWYGSKDAERNADTAGAGLASRIRFNSLRWWILIAAALAIGTVSTWSGTALLHWLTN